MPIAVGERLPDATLFELIDEGPVKRSVAEVFEGRTIALFGVPGAYTPTCHNRHMPSFVEAAPAFADHGVDEIVCVAVNDPFVLGAWAEASGAKRVGIRVISDPAAELVGAMGLSFDASARGLMTRSRRFSALVRDRELAVLNLEDAPGKAEATTAPVLLKQI
ncbi:MAG TPA: peroxiredoxin [Thermohalobaculum sp.]|nr:peroxiredoxin [Thermohalobaculum sp.]